MKISNFLQISELKLFLKTTKNGVIEYKEQDDGFRKLKNEPFFVVWKNFRIEKIYLNDEEQTSMRNLKKAIASLFQVFSVALSIHSQVTFSNSIFLFYSWVTRLILT